MNNQKQKIIILFLFISIFIHLFIFLILNNIKKTNTISRDYTIHFQVFKTNNKIQKKRLNQKREKIEILENKKKSLFNNKASHNKIFKTNDRIKITSNVIHSLNKEIQNSLVYPPRARELELEAVVIIKLCINKFGRLDSIKFIKKALFEDFNVEIIDKIKQWQYLIVDKKYSFMLKFYFQLKQ